MGASQGKPVKKTVSLPVVWLPEADAELKEALARYESRRPELGVRFAEAVQETVEAIAEGPLRFAVLNKARRRAGVRRFPYGITFCWKIPGLCDCLLSWKAPPETLAVALMEFGHCLPALPGTEILGFVNQIPFPGEQCSLGRQAA